VFKIPPRRILASNSLENQRKNGLLGDKVAQSCWVCSSNQISLVLPAPIPILFPFGSQGCNKRYGPTHSQVSLARRKVQYKKFHLVNWNIVSSPKDIEGLELETRNWLTQLWVPNYYGD
jgi:hypothetical protein